MASADGDSLSGDNFNTRKVWKREEDLAVLIEESIRAGSCSHEKGSTSQPETGRVADPTRPTLLIVGRS